METFAEQGTIHLSHIFSNVKREFSPATFSGLPVPVSIASSVRLLGTVEARFPSPAEESLADTLSLDDLLIQNREATFLLKMSGDSMSGAGIQTL